MNDPHNPHKPCSRLSYEVWGAIDYYRGCVPMLALGGIAGLLTGNWIVVLTAQAAMLIAFWTARRLIDRWVERKEPWERPIRFDSDDDNEPISRNQQREWSL